jgi:acyl dehydratase
MDRIGPAEIKIGDQIPETEVGPISRTLLALYAGASGDHNPLHIDIDAARQAGMSDVFAPGMLVFGAMSQRFSRWAGVERLRSFRVRFTSIVHLHDTIIFNGAISEIFTCDVETRARVELAGVTQDGRQVLSGDAVIRLTP